MDTILVVNAGSSSVKFQVFAVVDRRTLRCLIKGQVDGIGTRPRLRAAGADKSPLIDRAYDAAQIGNGAAAMQVAGTWLRDVAQLEPIAIGHRVVHGGPNYQGPALIDDTVLSNLDRCIPLAPLHQPNNLAPIRAIRARSPEIPQVACFDTAFHRTHSRLADHYAIPERLHAEGVRRYGFHGLSYEYVAARLAQIAPNIAQGRVIIAHLGSGASMCALAAGRSVESTMGFTALDGLPMGTRPGQLDPGVVLYLLEQKKMSAAAVSSFLYQQCGLKGLSGISNDVRELQASKDPSAAFALDFFAYRIALHAGLLAAALGGLDAFVFTAGIGENSPAVRMRVALLLSWLGADIDPAANAVNAQVISRPTTAVPLYVVPTDEELMIARHTLSILDKTTSDSRTPAMSNQGAA